MAGKVVRLCDYERRSREPDACAEQRDPSQAGATIIILPTKQHNTHRLYDGDDEGPAYPPCDVTFDDGVVTISVGERDCFGGPEARVFESHWPNPGSRA